MMKIGTAGFYCCWYWNFRIFFYCI